MDIYNGSQVYFESNDGEKVLCLITSNTGNNYKLSLQPKNTSTALLFTVLYLDVGDVFDYRLRAEVPDGTIPLFMTETGEVITLSIAPLDGFMFMNNELYLNNEEMLKIVADGNISIVTTEHNNSTNCSLRVVPYVPLL